MNNIYVDELPKNCSECPMCRSGNLKLQRKGRYVEAEQCVFGQYKYQTIDDEIDTCPLKPLTDRLVEERKKVCKEINDLVIEYFETNGLMGRVDIKRILDQIERGE